MNNKNKFTDDYKKEIVKLVAELDKKPADIVKDIGVTPDEWDAEDGLFINDI